MLIKIGTMSKGAKVALHNFEEFTYKELGYALYMTRRFTIEIEYKGHW
jgi:hypothetical protein